MKEAVNERDQRESSARLLSPSRFSRSSSTSQKKNQLAADFLFCRLFSCSQPLFDRARASWATTTKRRNSADALFSFLFSLSLQERYQPQRPKLTHLTHLLLPSPPHTPSLPPFQAEVPLAAPPPFTLADIKAAIPAKCFEKNAVKSMAYLAWDVAVVVGLAAAALAVNSWWSWPLYWIAQGTMFWALFVVGHDCGHQSFSNNKALNDLVGNITHSSILVPYHGWRVRLIWIFFFFPPREKQQQRTKRREKKKPASGVFFILEKVFFLLLSSSSLAPASTAASNEK